jgi:hypothetical protein
MALTAVFISLVVELPGGKAGELREPWTNCSSLSPFVFDSTRRGFTLSTSWGLALGVTDRLGIGLVEGPTPSEAVRATVDGRSVFSTTGLFRFLSNTPTLRIALDPGSAYSMDCCHSVHVKPATQTTGLLPPSPREACPTVHGKGATPSRGSLLRSERSDAGWPLVSLGLLLLSTSPVVSAWIRPAR